MIHPEKGEVICEYTWKGIWNLYESEVVLINDLVFVAGVDGTIFALDLANQEELWRVDISDSPLHLSLDNRNMYVVSESGDVAEIDSTSGEVLWNIETGFEIDSPAFIEDGLIYFTSGSQLYIINNPIVASFQS